MEQEKRVERLLGRLNDEDISDVAKVSIIEELEHMGVEVVRCTWQGIPANEGWQSPYAIGRWFEVTRKTDSSIFIEVDLGRRVTERRIHRKKMYLMGFRRETHLAPEFETSGAWIEWLGS